MAAGEGILWSGLCVLLTLLNNLKDCQCVTCLIFGCVVVVVNDCGGGGCLNDETNAARHFVASFFIIKTHFKDYNAPATK